MKPISPVPIHLLINTSNSLDSQRFPVPGKGKDLRTACSEFESLFLNKMLQNMRRTIPESGLLDGGMQEDIYTGLFDEQVARAVARGKGMGLGEMLFRRLADTYKNNGDSQCTATHRMETVSTTDHEKS